MSSDNALKILICDDHAIFRSGIRLVLEELDADLIEADSSEKALAEVHSGAVDLVLLDLDMPGVDGWSTLRTLRAEYPVIPVIIVSASDSTADMRRVLEEGAAGFIPKSSSGGVFRSALQLVLAGGVYVPPAALAGKAEEPQAKAHKSDEPSPDDRRRRAEGLTGRQQEVLELLARGLTNRDIARVLEIAEGTVKTHIRAILEALDVSNRTEAAMVLRDRGVEGTEPPADS